MATESGGEHQAPDPTFADVMNGFSFDSNRSSKRRRWGRRRAENENENEAVPSEPARPTQAGNHSAESVGRDQPGYPETHSGSAAQSGSSPQSGSAAQSGSWPRADRPVRPGPAEPAFDPLAGVDAGPAAVRPYAWTRGRTRSGFDLQVETLVSTNTRGRDQLGLLAFEHRAVAELCEQVRSVAEVAAMLSVPLGVAKVLVGDMAGLGLVMVHQTGGTNGDIPDLALMERVLSGLRRL
jgi:uncharacterized protein DUF742